MTAHEKLAQRVEEYANFLKVTIDGRHWWWGWVRSTFRHDIEKLEKEFNEENYATRKRIIY